MIWGGLLIVLGVLGLIQVYVDLTAWVWVAVLAAAGLGVFLIYLTDRSDLGLLIPAYGLWAVAGLVALIELKVLKDDWVALYALAAIALPFLVGFLRDRNQWGLLIPAYVLLAIAILLALTELGVLRDESVATYILSASALPFVVVFLRDRTLWWLLVPAYTLVAIGVMVWLIGLGVLDDLLVPAYIMFAVAIPFFVVYARYLRQWWLLVPGGIMAVFGLAFLIAEAAVEYVLPVVVILVGVWILARQFMGKEPLPPEEPSPPDPEAGEPPR
jgi:hypothetical protein